MRGPRITRRKKDGCFPCTALIGEMYAVRFLSMMQYNYNTQVIVIKLTLDSMCFMFPLHVGYTSLNLYFDKNLITCLIMSQLCERFA